MAPLTILSDDDVVQLLHSLTKKDILDLQQTLGDALHYYSTTTEEDGNGCCASFQPHRTSVQSKAGATTLFMPATSNDGIGVKIVTISETEPAKQLDNVSKASMSSKSSSISSASGQSSLSSLNNLSLQDSASSNSHRSSLAGTTIASSSPSGSRPDTPTKSADLVVTPNIMSKGSGTSPAGSLTLLDANGTPRALINAAEITAFRTALASTCLFKKRKNVHDMVIFGAGKQAYWHARLALLLRGDEIHHLTIFNRDFERAGQMIRRLLKDPWPVTLPRPQTAIITPGAKEYETHLKLKIRESSVIFCTTPSIKPLFPAEILTSAQGRLKGRYIAAIGSYKPHMVELHPDIVRQAVAPPHKHHHHKHAKTGGAIIVDSVEACLKEAGELIQAGIGGREVVELGELIMLRREAERLRAERAEHSDVDADGIELGHERKERKKGLFSRAKKEEKSEEEKREEKQDAGLREWLERGNVIFKSVGIGLMDVVVGGALVKIADERGVGTRIANF